MPREATIYCTDIEWPDTVVLNRIHLVFGFGTLVCVEILQFGTSSDSYASVLHVHIFLPLIRFLELMF